MSFYPPPLKRLHSWLWAIIPLGLFVLLLNRLSWRPRVLPTSDGARTVVFSPDGTLLAANEFSSERVTVWDARNRTVLKNFHDASDTSPNDYSLSMAISPDSKLLAVPHSCGHIEIWDVGSGTLSKLWAKAYVCVNDVAFSPDGQLLASAHADATVRIWDVRKGKLRHTLPGYEDVSAVTFSPDGEILATTDRSGMHFWQTRSFKPVKTPTLDALNRSGSAFKVVFSPDGKFVTGSTVYSSVLKIWDAKTGEVVRELPMASPPSSEPGAVAFSADSKMVTDGSRLWDVATGQVLREFPRISTITAGRAKSVAFSPDGTTLARIGERGAELWRLK